MVPFMWFVEFLQEFTKPLTLALRLYANILAGHLIIFVFLSFILYFGTFMAVISVPAAGPFFLFSKFFWGLPGVIFSFLSPGHILLALCLGGDYRHGGGGRGKKR